MKFISLTINHGLYQDIFNFSEGINIIYSKKNSVGKTTLLRFLLYSLGYNIPNIRGIDFEKCECELEIIDSKNNTCYLQRQRSIMSFKKNNDEIINYILPDDLNELHKRIYNISNIYILDNILGSCYVDQERGWTLLNRGKAIGKIYFNIERLISGLSERSYTDLEVELENIKREIQKYKYMYNVSQYQKEINEYNENITFDTKSEEIEKELDVLYSERKPILYEYERIKNVIKENTSFVKYITDFKLSVQKDDIIIPVNQETLVGFPENIEYLITKKQIYVNQLANIDKKIKTLKKSSNEANNLFTLETRIQEFDNDILKLNVNAIKTEKIIKQLENKKRDIEETIRKKVKENNPIIYELYQLIIKYTSELGIGNKYISSHPEYIFTKDLKSLSGAILHKIIFSFRISYIKLIYNHTGVKLPIIMDSPSGREVEKIKVEDMMTILSREFYEHQIIIASIFKYKFDNPNYIELKDRLFKYDVKEDNNK